MSHFTPIHNHWLGNILSLFLIMKCYLHEYNISKIPTSSFEAVYFENVMISWALIHISKIMYDVFNYKLETCIGELFIFCNSNMIYL